MKEKELSFEEAMKRLDVICEELSREGVTLERALALYEEGVKLTAVCDSKLEATERKIKMLAMSTDGELFESDIAPMDNE
jgi:exodeoxyribonuclease VII small subunit